MSRLPLRDNAIEAITRAFDTLDDDACRRLAAAMQDPERPLGVMVWLAGPRVDVCSVPVDPDESPTIIFSRYCGN